MSMSMGAVKPYLVGVGAAALALYWLIKVQKKAANPYMAAAENGAPLYAWDVFKSYDFGTGNLGKAVNIPLKW